MKSANNRMLPALLSTGLLAFLALVLGWIISHPANQPLPIAATATLPLPTPAITYPPGPYVPLGASRLGPVTRLDRAPQLSFYDFQELATDGTALVGESVDGFRSVILIDPASSTSHELDGTDYSPHPQLSDRYVVWTNQAQLHYYDRATQRAAVLEPTDKVRRTALAGSVVVWENSSSTGQQIMGQDFSSGRTFTVSESNRADGPLISGQWAVYIDRLDDMSGAYGEQYDGLHATNISTGETIAVDHIARHYLEVDYSKYYAIDVPWIVWSSQAIGQPPRLNVYSLDTRRSRQVALPARCPANTLPDMPIYLVASDGVVLFTDNCGTAGYDMSRDEFFALPLNQHDSQTPPALSYALANGQLFWSDIFASHAEIYTAPIISPP